MVERGPNKTESQIIKALEAKSGFITHAAKALGITYQGLSQRIRRSDKLKAALEAIQESHLDLAEISLMKKIRDEELGAICFYLKCKGKGRGYIERQQMEVNDVTAPQPVQVVIQVEDATISKSEHPTREVPEPEKQV